MAKKSHVVGGGNVFADLGHPRPAEALAKAELARKIGAIIERRGLTQAAAAAILEVDQPKVSALIRGRLAGFSLDRLVRFLVLLGSDVEIVVKQRRRTQARVEAFRAFVRRDASRRMSVNQRPRRVQPERDLRGCYAFYRTTFTRSRASRRLHANRSRAATS